MAETKTWAIGLVVLCTLFTAIGSLLLKKGADRLEFSSLQGIMQGYLVLIGLTFYFVGFLLLMYSFKHGELSVLFPFVSLSFVWVVTLATIVLKEKVTFLEILGVATIVAGVVMIGLSSRKRRTAARG
ncbi:EamA family transporter [archaeon]|nr:EamA family transporter [archaeon]